MKLHEYQSKFRFAEFGIPIPRGKIATTPEEAFRSQEIGGPTVMKARDARGRRGKRGRQTGPHACEATARRKHPGHEHQGADG